MMSKLLRMTMSSIKIKMLAMFVILTSIPLIVVGLISYQKSFTAVSEHSKAATIYIADQLARSIDILFQDASRLLELEKNPNVLQFLFSQTDSYSDAKQILLAFDLYRKTYRYDNVLNISMVNLYGRGISERKGVFALTQNPLRNPHFQHLFEHPEEVLVIPPSRAVPLDRLDGFSYSGHGVISIMATVKQRVTHEVIGFIVIDLNDEFVQQFSDSYHIGKTGRFVVTDNVGRLVYQPADMTQHLRARELPSQMEMPKGSFVVNGNGKPLFVSFTTSESTDWKIIGLAPLQEVVADAHEIRQLIVVGVGLSITFVVILYFFISSRLTSPIQVLQNRMRKAASGNLDAKVSPKGSDEITDLGNSFNKMIEQLKALIARSVREQQQIRKAELRTLQAQINPHFLYNTLDSIVWMAEAGKNDQVIRLVKALSRFFRISLSKGKDWITVASEIEHVHYYLVIQQIRYRDILEFYIDVESGVMKQYILKMTLQPIVENALYHGIKNKRGKGMIRVSGHADNTGQTLVVQIQDNGIGMSRQMLNKLMERISGNNLVEAGIDTGGADHEGGFGLHNVNQRLRLYYGAEYGLAIDSEEGIGTTVTIKVPILPGGN